MNTEKTYTLEDLEHLEFPGTALAVLGDPVKHSLSPVMHNAALAVLAESDVRFKDWVYYRFEVPAAALVEALPRFHAKGFMGLNLTVPHKVLALEFIESLSAEAEAMGAVNTLKRTESGWEGFNTDGYGMERGLNEELGLALRDSEIILVGSGGAARAAAAQCLRSGCAKLYLGNRSQARLAGLYKILRDLNTGIPIETFELNDLPRDLSETGVLINATSLGLRGEDPAPIAVAGLTNGWSVYDMVYNPPETRLLMEARAGGMATANGLSMLVHQGARALELWTGAIVDADRMQAAAEGALAKNRKDPGDA
ncbi:MAG: shikimate dehydrogenase [Verrucomicrobia bacterium]|nr:shikimate dehydrogenase [Verrucomicrobiota bacterium]